MRPYKTPIYILQNIPIITASPVVVTKCTTQFTLTTVKHIPYLCIPSLLTVSCTYCTVLLLTVIERNELHQQRTLISGVFYPSNASVG